MNEYFRFIYQNVEGGMCCTGSLSNPGDGEDGMFHFLYVSGGSKVSEGESAKLPVCGHYHLLILADFSRLAIKRALAALKHNQVDSVVCPSYERAVREAIAREYEETGELSSEGLAFVLDPAKSLKENGIAAAELIGDTKVFCKGNRTFTIYSVGEGRAKSLVLCHAGKGVTPQNKECVMNVKPVTRTRACSPFVDPGNLNCEMRCMLYNDFTQCKRQNQKNGEYFSDGHLLLGTADPGLAAAKVKREMPELWKRLRFIAMAGQDGDAAWSEDLLGAGTEDCAQYFIGPEGTDARILKAVLESNPYRTFLCTGSGAGLCASGCYADR